MDEGYDDSRGWLQPDVTRADAELQLTGRPDGTFLVRRSESYPDWFDEVIE